MSGVHAADTVIFETRFESSRLSLLSASFFTRYGMVMGQLSECGKDVNVVELCQQAYHDELIAARADLDSTSKGPAANQEQTIRRLRVGASCSLSSSHTPPCQLWFARPQEARWQGLQLNSAQRNGRLGLSQSTVALDRREGQLTADRAARDQWGPKRDTKLIRPSQLLVHFRVRRF